MTGENDSERQFFRKIEVVSPDGSTRKMTDEEIDQIGQSLEHTREITKEHDWDAAARQIEELIDGLTVTHLGGYVPIQGEGTYKGHEFYFRARYSHATLSIGTYNEDGIVDSWHPRYQATLVVTDDEFGAGWLSPDEVVALFPLLVERLEPRTRDEGDAAIDAFSQQIKEAGDMMRQGDEIRNIETTEDDTD